MNKPLPVVDALNGLLIKNHANGQVSIAKNGTQLMAGDQVVLLSGEALLRHVTLGDAALGLERPFKIDGISPLLKNITSQADAENLIEHAIANGIDPVAVLEALEPTAAGEEVLLGEGGNAVRIDPLYGVGSVSAGYETIGPELIFRSAERYIPLFEEEDEIASVTESLATEESPESSSPEPSSPEPLQLSVVDLAYDETDGLALGSAAIQTNAASEDINAITFSASDATWDAASQTLRADDSSWELRFDPNTGQYEFQQLRAWTHPDTTDHDDAMSVRITVTLTRTDGAQATRDFTVRVDDDGPRIVVENVPTPDLSVDETVLANDATGDFRFLFNAQFGTDDAAANNPLTYSLAIKSTGVDSGLVDTATQQKIYLFLENGVVVGHVGSKEGAEAFRISLDNDGKITLDQQRALVHPDATTPDDVVHLAAADLITLEAVATDSDGDSSRAVANIGLAFNFADDGPSVVVNANAEAGVLLTTQDADTIGAATDTATTTANFSGVFSNTPTYGADGAGSTVMSYSLALAGAPGTDSGLDSDGLSIYLYDIAGVIVGSTAAALAGVDASNTIFDLSVDASGVVTLNQYEEIDHPIANDPSPTGSPFADQFAVLSNGLVTLTASALTTDGDGDTATDSETIDLGGNVRFADDGPSVVVNANAEAGVLLTTQDADTIGAATDTATTTANFSGVFSNTPTYGADGAGSTVMSYSLALAGAPGTDSGLDSDGLSIYLYDIAGVIVGSTAAALAGVDASNTIFDLSVNASGVVTLNQYEEIDHPIANDPSPTGSPFADQFAVLGNGLVTLTASALTTDGDGDTATDSETIDLGGNVRFADDGPSVVVNANAEAGVLLTTQDADTIGAATDTATTTANFSGVFSNTPTYGADGAGSTVMSYSLALAGAPGTDSGLDSDGLSIYLYDIAGVIVGSTAAALAGVDASNTIFDLSVDASGVVTLNQYEEIDHPIANDPSPTGSPFADQFAVLGNGLVTLTASALTTDGDGDTATDSETIDLGGNVRFADDGPSVVVNANAEAGVLLTTQDADTIGAATDTATTTANFSGVFSNTPTYGADGAGSTVMSYSLALAGAPGTDSGLDSDGLSIYLYDIAGVIVGSTAAALAGVDASNTIFDLSVDASGVVTLNQYEEIDHPIANDPNPTGSPFADQFAVLSNGLVTLTASALTTDGDGDTATDSETIDLGGNVRFADDGPSVVVNANAEAGVLLTTQDADTIGAATDTATTTANFSGVFSNTPTYGADGAGSTVMSYSLALAGAPGTDSGLDSDGLSIYLYDIAGVIVGSTAAALAGVDASNTIFDLSVDASGVVTLNQYEEIDHPIANDPSPTGSPFADQFAVLSNGLVTLTASALTTDGDGDTATDSETIDLGGNVRFADDGPSVVVNANAEAGVLLTTQDADTIGAATDTATTTANFSGVFSNTPTYGADGAGSTVMSYSLALAGAPGTDSGLDSDGLSIYLYDIAGVIVGSTAAALAGVDASNTIFDLSVDASGVVTLNQYEEIDHPIANDPSPTGSPFADQFAVLGNGLVTLTASALTTDGDGDTATDSETIDLGGNVRFADDGPSVVVNANAEAGVLLTTQDADTIGAATDTATTTANFSGVFSNTPTYGADGAGSTVMSYSLALAGAPGTDSGLDSDGLSIYLYDIAGVIVGSTAAALAGVDASNTIFDLSVDASGVVTLKQYEEIDHPIANDPSPTGSPFADQFAVLSNGLVTLTASALTTDGDGDTATDSETIDLGGNVRFADDGPSVVVNANAEAGVLLTTQDADTIGAATDTATTTANFSGVFSNTPTYGADGAGSTVMSYSLALAGAPGTDSGLDSDGLSIYLYDIAGVIVGSTAAALAGVDASNTIFDLSVNASGVVTLNQYEEIDHPIANDPSPTGSPFADQFAVLGNGLVTLTASALTTDGDGDTATDSETIDLGGNVRFADDGPSVVVNANAEAGVLLTTQDADTIGAATDTATTTANFSGVFSNTPTYGADGAGSTVMSYSLALAGAPGTDSGLDSDGLSIYLYDIAGVIVGSTAAALAGVDASNTIFDLSVDASGVVTLNQYEEIDHPIANDPSPTGSPFADQFAVLSNGLVTLTASALTTDGDGDTATDSETIDLGGNVRFADDGPSVVVNANAEAGVLLTTQDADTIGAATDTATTTANFSGVFSNTPTYGADGAGSTVMSYSLALAGAPGTDSGLDSDGLSIYLYDIAGVIVGSTAAALAGVDASNTIFDLSVDASGVVTLNQYEEIDHPIANDPSPTGSPFADQFAVLGNGLVTLTASALTTDGDGDTATDSETIDLGGNVRFADDGPSVVVNANAEAGVLLTTQDADTIGAATDTATTTANFSGVFSNTPTYGADGAGSTVMSYSLALAGAPGTDSGLDSDGLSIYLYDIAGVIVGSTAAALAGVDASNTIFDLSVDASGVVTLKQYEEIDHPIANDPSPTGSPFADQFAVLSNGLVTLTASALTTDGDGDTATDSETIDLGGNVRFADDGPSVVVNANAEAGVLLTTQDADTIGAATDTATTTANFSGVFSNTPTYGADGAGSTVMSYSLALAGAPGTDSGLDSDGLSIYLYDIAGVIVGSTAAALAGVDASNTIFDLSVDASGVVTLNQYEEIDHPIANDPSPTGSPFADQFAVLSNGLVTLTASALTTDGDGDTATDSETIDLGGNVRFADDGPSVVVNANAEAGVLLTTQDADTIGAATDTATTTANFSGVFSNTPTYGADGAGSTVMSYSLALAGAPGTDSGLDSDGLSIYLYDIAGVIVGSTAAALAGVDASNTIFDLSVDASGVVTLNQYEEIDHPIANDPSPTGSPFADQFAVLSNGLVTLTASALTTDGDGDTATDSETIDLGGNVRFADDGPSVVVNANAEAGVLLTTQDADTIGAATDTATTTANFSGVFSNTPTYGADGAGSTVMSYSLALAGAPGTDSGLDSDGLSIYLYDIAGVIVGSTAAALAGVDASNTIFDLSVDASGVVTLNQYEEIDHPIANDPSPTGSPFADQFAVLGNGLVTLTASALTTDGDGDTATDSETIDLGGNVRFADDGPSVVVNANAEAGVLLTTQDADTIGAATDTATTTANFSGVFSNTPTYGADGAGSTVMSYSLALAGAPGTDSGLDSDGLSIYLYDIAGVIVGSTAAALAGVDASNTIFDLSVDASGVVTLKQYEEIDHPIANDPSPTGSPFADQFAVLGNGLVTLTASALTTDGDGDTATDSETIDLGGNVRFADDGPHAGTQSLTADEDNLAKGNNNIVTGDDAQSNLTGTLVHNFGADGAGKIDFVAMNGLTATLGAESIKYSWNASDNTLTAYRANGVLGTDDVFKITVNPVNGQYTFTLLAAVNHHEIADNNETTNASVNLNYTVTDGDGDTSIGSLTVVIDDDVPTIIDPEGASLGNVAGSTTTFSLDTDGNIDNNVGADQLGSISFSSIVDGQQATGVIDGDVVNLSANGFPIHLYLVDHDSNVATPDTLQGWIKGAPGDVGAIEVFRITLQPDGNYNLNNDTYKVEIFVPIGTSTTTTITNTSFATAGNKAFNFIDVSGTTEDLLFSGYVRATNGSLTQGTVNTNSTAVGVNNQSMNDGDNLRIDFVNSPSVTNSASNSYNYTDHFDINNFNFKIVQVNGNPPPGSIEIWVRTYDANDDDPSGTSTSVHNAQLADDPQTTISTIKVNGVSLDLDDLQSDGSGGYLIRGLSLNDIITVGTDEGYNRIEIENARSGAHGINDSTLNGEAFDIGLFSYETIVTNVPNVNMNFEVALQDADGDTSLANLTVNLAEPVFKVGTNTSDSTSSPATYEVGSGTGTITGNGGNDVLVGDVGGIDATLKSINLLLILDTSGSMSNQIPFGGSTISRMQALKNAVSNLLNELAESQTLNVRVHIVQFNTNAAAVGTFNLVVNGAMVDTALEQSLIAINGLSANGGTNYEAAFQNAYNWANGGGPLTGDQNLINQTIFISDGAPTYYLNSNGTVGGTGSTTTERTVYDPLGATAQDNVNEVALLEQTFGPIEAIGINVSETAIVYNPSGTANDLTAKQILDKMEGSNPSSLSNNIDSAEELNQVLSDLSPLNQLNTVGDDRIVGDYGDDILYGDALNTDELATLMGLDLFDFPEGSGWSVFDELENNSQYNWTREDTLDYINNHSHELAQETLLANGSGRAGGNDYIDSGAGNDRIYGQEGNDEILAGRGADVVDPGTGNNIIDFGIDTDSDTLLLNLETFKGHNTIKHFDPQQDVLKFESVLGVETVDDLDELLDQNNPFSKSGDGQDLNVNFASGAQLTFEGLGPSIPDVQGLQSLQDIVQQPIVVVNELGG
ncbi:structural toxin protein RtxA [Legionella lansingensis]|uniref:DUF5801 repeats-in-toxin domain-containing protein n=2 Tax=Legionella lansingensis TaxID=45067 RepID=UPI000B949762|nr:DUF5801 repeats-in-toxin domain-containing protein [Legionella lansingensis]SNV49160.1 structural toxin protein RtxA [Legionella lansingensis]